MYYMTIFVNVFDHTSSTKTMQTQIKNSFQVSRYKIQMKITIELEPIKDKTLLCVYQSPRWISQ
jgi:hypothetical protein